MSETNSSVISGLEYDPVRLLGQKIRKDDVGMHSRKIINVNVLSPSLKVSSRIWLC